eukprot:scaffold22925_cov19-Tisochrysis_lutea.AAC.2
MFPPRRQKEEKEETTPATKSHVHQGEIFSNNVSKNRTKTSGQKCNEGAQHLPWGNDKSDDHDDKRQGSPCSWEA